MKPALALFALLTVALTWPQARHLSTDATPHQDVYFNMWRLRWFAHALPTRPAHLFDANIFFPESRTLALSDAMVVEGAAAAPLLWSGVGPVLVHNLLLLSAIALSGAAMFALARYLTGSRGAGVVAGIVFAFAPYRFEHIMHLELQWTMWMPLAFLWLHRTLDTGRWRWGAATGAAVGLQMLSSIYYGIFLATLISLAALLLISRDRHVSFARAARALAGGGMLAIVVCAIYARPYVRVHAGVGDRPLAEVTEFSAKPSDYLSATPNNTLYGSGRRSRPERRLFPGAVAVLLAMIGALAAVPSRRTIVYLLLLATAFEMSLGLGGYSYRFLHDHVSIFRGLRALARLGVFVLMFVAILAAVGYTALVAGRSLHVRRALLFAIAAAALAEYRVRVALVPLPNDAPALYVMLARQPVGAVAEFPVPRVEALPGRDAEYAYLSTFHWFPLVNGYSGVYPPSYLARLERLRDFPGDRSLAQLRSDGVAYVIVHAAGYHDGEIARVRSRLVGDGMAELGRFHDGDAGAYLFRRR